jgi:hypothetical protein
MFRENDDASPILVMVESFFGWFIIVASSTFVGSLGVRAENMWGRIFECRRGTWNQENVANVKLTCSVRSNTVLIYKQFHGTLRNLPTDGHYKSIDL